ncbi:hypothetical protein [Nocardia elegans]|uniref:hypothetical protein n=1 Tax=Nocardia elegans TaxID=300029 RepID=UPI001E3EA717|nr:hypothetical protein [Nocardia elegans]
MIVIFGLVILVAAVIIGVVGVFANSGNGHVLTDNFAAFGYHVTGSTGVLFLYGMVVGAVALAGLGLLLAGARRTARRGRAARDELHSTRPETPVYYSHTGTTSATTEPAEVTEQRAPGRRTSAPRRGMGRMFGRRPAVH